MVTKICISGLTASGKTVISDALAADLGFRHVQNSYKGYLRENEELSTFIDSTGEEFVKGFDRKTVEMADESDCVVSAWLGPWIIEDAALRVWVYAGLETRIRRYMKRENIDNKEDAEKRISDTDISATESFKKFYSIDINKHDDFDLQINTERINPKCAVDAISLVLKEKIKT